MSRRNGLHSRAGHALLSCVGIEVELMIVDRDTLDVRPLADHVLRSAGEVVSELESGELVWSNELVAHVLEIKTNGPVRAVDAALLAAIDRDVHRIDNALAECGARLLPSAMHPWMDPSSETVLWPHDYNHIYRAYDRVFDCRGHGWSNLQSLHLNLPFAGDQEFGRLHSAIRLLLPLLPALAASSPLVEGSLTGALDNRISFYRTNASRVRSVAGDLIPEPVFSRAEYQRNILSPMYSEIAPFDPEGILRHEFLNSRGAIARFDRSSIEIRVIDSQECPLADLSIAAGVLAVLRLLVAESPSPDEPISALHTRVLVDLLERTAREGAAAEVDDPAVLQVLAMERSSAGEVWRQLTRRAIDAGILVEDPWGETLLRMIAAGPLAARICRAVGPRPSREAIVDVYRRLADCLLTNALFEPEAWD